MISACIRALNYVNFATLQTLFLMLENLNFYEKLSLVKYSMTLNVIQVTLDADRKFQQSLFIFNTFCLQ